MEHDTGPVPVQYGGIVARHTEGGVPAHTALVFCFLFLGKHLFDS